MQAWLHVQTDAHVSCPERSLGRTLSDCPDVHVGMTDCPCRAVGATHPAASNKSCIGQTRTGVVSERFFTCLLHESFTASDVIALSLRRGACEPVLSDEDGKVA
jgi:hypothetical protein